MHQAVITVISLVLASVAGEPQRTCTIFKVTRQDRTIVGNNEDDNSPNTRAWFLVPERSKYGRIFVGDFVPPGGMNDQGFFFDWVADNPSNEPWDAPSRFQEGAPGLIPIQ